MNYAFTIKCHANKSTISYGSLIAHKVVFQLSKDQIKKCNKQMFPIPCAYQELRKSFRAGHYEYILLSNRMSNRICP